MATEHLPELPADGDLPPIIAGAVTPSIREKVHRFYFSVAEIFEAWVRRRGSAHTQRAYRQDVMHFVRHSGWRWPEDAPRIFAVKVQDVQAYRAWLTENAAAPKTINRRISSLSGFFKYLGSAAAELRLPIVIGNPAHSQFIPREATDPVEETRALTANRARQVMSMPQGDDLIALRDRAILKFYLYTGARIETGCRLKVPDFHLEEEESTITISEKGHRRRKIGLHYFAAEAIREYVQTADIKSGPLFRPRLNSRSKRLASRPFHPVTMYRLLQSYFERLPGAIKEIELPDGTVVQRCIYTPHSLRATVATLLLESGVDIIKVQELLGHKHVTTTQIYDKRRRSTSESASHVIPL